MIYRLLILSLLLTNTCAFAQIEQAAVKTENHVNVKGTQVFLEPPAGFETATNFLGFQHTAFGASIMVIQLSGPYNEITKGFTTEYMKPRGMTLLKSEPVTIDQYKGALHFIQQYSAAHGMNFLKYTLVLDLGSNATLMINGGFPESQKETLEAEIRKAVLSVYIAKSIKVDPFSSLDFTIDLGGTRFKLSDKSLSGSLILQGPAGEFMMIGKAARPLSTADKKGSAIASLKGIKTIQYLDLVDFREIVQDVAEGCQVTANITENGVKKKAYQTILFGENYYYIFLAIVSANDKSLLTDFEKIVRSFKRK